MNTEVDRLITLILNEAAGIETDESDIKSLFQERLNNAKLYDRKIAHNSNDRFALAAHILRKPVRSDAKKWVEQIDDNTYKIIEVAPFDKSAPSPVDKRISR